MDLWGSCADHKPEQNCTGVRLVMGVRTLNKMIVRAWFMQFQTQGIITRTSCSEFSFSSTLVDWQTTSRKSIDGDDSTFEEARPLTLAVITRATNLLAFKGWRGISTGKWHKKVAIESFTRKKLLKHNIFRLNHIFANEPRFLHFSQNQSGM